MRSKDKVAELMSILESTGKHTSYQEFPPNFPSDLLPTSDSPSLVRQDAHRFNWLRSKVKNLTGPAIDIGANLGYFSFRLNDAYDIPVVAYEPFEPHAASINLIRDICGIDEATITVECSGVGLREIEALPNVELIALLNVVQHAGDDFDSDLVSSIDDWREYAIEYLRKIRQKTRLLFFQTGYSWMGHGAKLCPDDEIIDYTVSLLHSAGWTIRHCGVIPKVKASSPYDEYNVVVDGHNPVLIPELNHTLFDRIGNKLLRKRNQGVLHRFCQRPLWLCESV